MHANYSRSMKIDLNLRPSRPRMTLTGLQGTMTTTSFALGKLSNHLSSPNHVKLSARPQEYGCEGSQTSTKINHKPGRKQDIEVFEKPCQRGRASKSFCTMTKACADRAKISLAAAWRSSKELHCTCDGETVLVA